jgi:hypothetical protein
MSADEPPSTPGRDDPARAGPAAAQRPPEPPRQALPPAQIEALSRGAAAFDGPDPNSGAQACG